MSHEHTQHHSDPATFHIVVNARPAAVESTRITYQEIVQLAFPGEAGDILYSVVYTGPKHADGMLAPGQSVALENGMKFDVTANNRS